MPRTMAFLLAGAWIAAIGAAIPATSLAQDSTADKVRLAWKFQSGQTIHYVVEQSSNVGMGKGTGQSNQTIDMEWRVKNVDDSQKAAIEQTIQRMRMSLDMPPLGKINYDSKSAKPKDPVGQAIAGVMSKLVGKKFQVEMTPEGKVESPKAAPARTKKKPAAKGNDPLGGIAPDADMWQGVVAQATLPLPAEPIAAGHRWTHESAVDLPQIGKQTIATAYHYVGPEQIEGRTLHKIEVVSEIKAADGAAGAMEINKHAGEGVIYFDAEAGLLDHGRMSQTTSVKIANPVLGGGTYDVEAETKIRRVE